MNERILVVAVHPDDETLGCGGTLLKHKDVGDEVFWLIVTEISAHDASSHDLAENRKQEIEAVKKKYAFDGIFSLGFLAKKVDTYAVDEIISGISAVMNEVKPTIVYLPFRGDVHSDHRVIFEAVYSCTKTFRYPFIKKILMMETPSETDFSCGIEEARFLPNYFVDISECFQEKLEILKIYTSELGEHPFPRSLKNVEALAITRGAITGCQYAESFMLLKERWM